MDFILHANFFYTRTLPTTSVGGTLAFYTGPSMEAGEPGTLYVNVSDLASFPKYEVTSLMLHEAEPGHHLQVMR